MSAGKNDAPKLRAEAMPVFITGDASKATASLIDQRLGGSRSEGAMITALGGVAVAARAVLVAAVVWICVGLAALILALTALT